MSADDMPLNGRARLAFCDCLGDSWRRLAIALDIPPHDQQSFKQGAEAADILAWVEQRRYWARLYEALTLIGREELLHAEPAAGGLIQRLQSLTLTHRQRERIGDQLAETGDPRPGVGLTAFGLPDIAWCAVPGGTTEIAEGHSRQSFDVQPFWIGKYPITWVQYQSFLIAEDGYRIDHWWHHLGWRDHQAGSSQFQKILSFPAETMAWYDAVAFCRWLSEKLALEIRLVYEWEWQYAAMGADPDRRYPWGSHWTGRETNSAESRLCRTTAVGLYPEDTSPFGVMDMAGNVREWCQNDWYIHGLMADPDPSGSTDQKATRGGNYLGNQHRSQNQRRGSTSAHAPDRALGFRVATTRNPA